MTGADNDASVALDAGVELGEGYEDKVTKRKYSQGYS